MWQNNGLGRYACLPGCTFASCCCRHTILIYAHDNETAATAPAIIRELAMIWRSHREIISQPYSSLAAFFLLWKGLLLLLACLSPGIGYDTSTDLLLQLDAIPSSNHTVLQQLAVIVSDKFVRWDAIYFATIAQHGYVYEQEWAFGWGFAMLSRMVARCRDPNGVQKHA